MKWVVVHGSLKSGVAGFCWSSKIASVWVWCCWVSRLLRLVMGLVVIDMGYGKVMASFCYGSAWVRWVLLWIPMAIAAPRSLAPH